MSKLAKQCVEAGTKLLDERRPGWYKQVDTDKLRLDSPQNCILGQLSPAGESYHLLARDLGIDRFGIMNYGFDAHSAGRQNIKEAFDELRDEWVRVINERMVVDSAEKIISEAFAVMEEESLERDLVTV